MQVGRQENLLPRLLVGFFFIWSHILENDVLS